MAFVAVEIVFVIRPNMYLTDIIMSGFQPHDKFYTREVPTLVLLIFCYVEKSFELYAAVRCA